MTSMAGAVMEHDMKEQDLAEALAETLTLLDGVAEHFWVSKIRNVLDGAINPGEILSWYGGMGSFNDLVIAKVNGHHVQREQEPVANARLTELRRRVYDLATHLRT